MPENKKSSRKGEVVGKTWVWGEANGPDHSDYYEAADIRDADTGKYIRTDFWHRCLGKFRRNSWFSK